MTDLLSSIRRRAWANRPLRTKGLVIMAVPLIPLIIAMVFVYQGQAADQRIDARISEHRRQRVATANLLTLAVDAQTGVRGYLLTRRERFLEPYFKAIEGLPDALRAVDAYSPEEQAPLIASLRSTVEERLDLLSRLRALEPSENGQRRILLDRDKALMDSLRGQTAVILEQADLEMSRALAERTRVHDRTSVLLRIGAAAGLVGLMLAILFLSGIVRRVRISAENARRLPQRLPLVALPESNDEIGDLGRAMVGTAELLEQQERDRIEAESALREAKRAAERANEAKSDFLSRMSHELRTPLNGILGFAQILELEGLDPDQEEGVRQIVVAGKHLLDLINEVLDLARIESGRLPLSLEPVPVDEVMAEVITLIKPLAAERNIIVQPTTGANRAQHVRADRQRLKQILLNLASNAVKYNVDGGTIRVGCEWQGDDRIAISITDTGLGIPPEKLDRVFAAFDRLDVEDAETEGTGLGLALSLRLAEAMGGELTVDSEPGRTTFAIELSIAEAPAERAAVVHEIQEVAPIVSTPSDVLYIEDNLANVKLIERIFKRRPHVKLQMAMQGRLGLDLAKETQPDLVLLDLNLPDMDGKDVLLRLRQHPSTRDIPVVVLSADATPGQIQRLADAGATAYVTKPLQVTEFLNTVDGILEEGLRNAGVG